jgi:hypothetical protein
MTVVQLIADTNVVSYMSGKSPLGAAYSDLIDDRCVGVTGHTLAELRVGTLRRAPWPEEVHRRADRLG